MKRSLIILSVFTLLNSNRVFGQQDKDRETAWPIAFSSAYLIDASAGAMLAIHADLRQRPFGIQTGQSAKQDFWLGTGTALSPGFVFIVTQSISTVLAARSGNSERIGLIGLGVHGIGFTIGALAEPITYECLGKPSANPARTIVAVGNVVLPALMTYTALKAL